MHGCKQILIVSNVIHRIHFEYLNTKQKRHHRRRRGCCSKLSATKEFNFLRLLINLETIHTILKDAAFMYTLSGPEMIHISWSTE
jgi:hypothetical protein